MCVADYGNADYDARHYFSLNYVWDVPRFWGPRAIFGDWTVAGTIFARSGLPLTVVDSNATSILASNNFGGVLNAARVLCLRQLPWRSAIVVRQVGG